jgi:hypothetical protein
VTEGRLFRQPPYLVPDGSGLDNLILNVQPIHVTVGTLDSVLKILKLFLENVIFVILLVVTGS